MRRVHLGRSSLATLSAVVAVFAYACADDEATPGPLGVPDASLAETSAPEGGSTSDAGTDGASNGDTGAGDAAHEAATDAASDAAITSWSCGAFTEAPTWTVNAGFRAVVVAKGGAINQPVALAFATGVYGGLLYVVNQGDNVLRTVNTQTGAVNAFTAGAQWGGRAPTLLTTITWDEENTVDGQLYVGDQGTDSDGDSAVYRVGATGAASTYLVGPGYGLDDIYGLAFAPADGGYPQGLYITGDTVGGAPVHWGVFGSGSVDAGLAFSDAAGTQGIAFARLPAFGGVLLASRPNGGGFEGTNDVSRILADGGVGAPLASGIPGVHAVTYSKGGAFGQNVYVASWSTGKIFSIDAAGATTELASGLTLTNYDGNILAVSPDGNTMMVADRGQNRIVCIEPI